MTLPASPPNASGTSVLCRGMRRFLSHVTLQEVSGALGDLGSFLPVVVALVPAAQLDLGTTLVLTGAYNIASGMSFGIPMCVQPMSTIAAIALTPPGLSLAEIVAAGAFVSGCVLLLGVTRVIDLVTRVTPAALVAAIQLAVGLKLAQQGIRQVLMHTESHAAPSLSPPTAAAGGSLGAGSHNAAVWRPFGGMEGWGLGVAVVLYLLLVTLPQGRQQQADEGQEVEQQQQQQQQQEEEEEEEDEEQQQQQLRTGRHTWHSQLPDGPQHRASGSVDIEQQQPLLATHIECTASSTSSTSDEDCHMEQQQQVGHQATRFRPAAPVSRAHGRDHTSSPVVMPQGPFLPYTTCSSSSSSSAKSPAALVVVVLGLVLTYVSNPGVLSDLQLGPSRPRLILPSRHQLLEGVRKAGLAQLPTTALNSVVAVSALAHQLYPHAAPVEAAAWRPSAVATSVGVMNLLGVWWGALPCCHGAGGLAAQHKFGARSGAAPVMLGAAKLVLGLCFGSSLFQLLQHFPGPLLGSLLLVAGLELARSVQRLHLNSQGFGEMLVAVAVMLGVGDIALGFGCGVVLHVALLLQGWVARRVPLS